jgi:hypothetical protein
MQILKWCCVAILAASEFMFSGAAQANNMWQNETNTPQECDYCNLQYPFSFTLVAGQISPLIYGQIYETGVTESGGANSSVRAELGFGPSGSDPRTSTQWHWFAATYNTQIGNNDEYRASFIAPSGGNYNYTYRFSVDGGISFAAADINGAGSFPGLAFEPSQLGSLTVPGGPALPVPEPETYAMMMAGLSLLGFSARRRKQGTTAI